MPVINFAPADFLQTKVVEVATYPTVVSKIEGPNKSNSGKSYNYFLDLQISDGKYKGKTRTVCFNTEGSSPSLLGEMQFFPVSYLLLLAQAQGLVGEEPGNFQLDTDQLIDKPMMADWGVAPVEGRLVNIINGFHPANYDVKPAF